MANDASPTNAFLSGQGIAVPLAEVESELARLWGPSAERIGGPELESPNVTRVALANLVVAALGPDSEGVGPVLDTVVVRRPCRAIVLAPSDRSEDRRVESEVAALCHLPAPGRPQVCSERIVLRAGPTSLDLLPGAVFSLLESDLPVILWWVGDPRPALDLFRTLAAESARLIPDLTDPSPDLDALRVALDPAVHPFGRDLAWFGITRWRELVAQFFDPPAADNTLARLASVAIRAAVPAVAPEAIPRVAAWLAAWLAGQLSWTPIQRAPLAPDQLAATFSKPDGTGEVSVTIQVERDLALTQSQVRHVRLSAPVPDGEETFDLSRPPGRPEEVRITTCSATRCALPRLVLAPEPDPAHRVAAALESARDDPPYRHALPHLRWLLEM